MHMLWEEFDKAQIRQIESRVKDLMAQRNDYQAYYYKPGVAKYHRIHKEESDKLDELYGDN